MAQAIPDDTLQPDVDRLQALVDGLWYPSETDAPITVVVWPISPSENNSEESALPQELAQELAAAGTPITQHPAEQFFQPILSQPFWHSPQGDHLAQRYQSLQAVLQPCLSHLRTYRIGQVDITLYLIGQHPSGHYLGLKTHLVET
jgi:hypothetical protein